MLKIIQEALVEKEWKNIDINVYFYWNEESDNSGQIHIRSSKSMIGFKDGEIVNILVDVEIGMLLIVGTGEVRDPGQRAKETDKWRVLIQGNLKHEDFDFKCRPLFTLLDITKTITLKGTKVRASNYLDSCIKDQFAIIVNLRQLQLKKS